MGALESAIAKVENSSELRDLTNEYRTLYARYAAEIAGVAILGIVTLGIGALMYGVSREGDAQETAHVVYLQRRIRKKFTQEEFEAYFPAHRVFE
jgi:hypothetical protein